MYSFLLNPYVRPADNKGAEKAAILLALPGIINDLPESGSEKIFQGNRCKGVGLVLVG
jgi:hypothetical protein